MISFIKASSIVDAESAERVFSPYKNRDVDLKLDYDTVSVSLLDAESRNGVLYLKFSWQSPDIGNDYRIIRSKLGKSLRLQINAEGLAGVLGSTTEFPSGADLDQYKNSPFVLAITFPDARTAGAGKGSIIGIDVPSNIAEMLPLSDDLEYEPHITVAYFPDISPEDIPLIMKAVEEASKKVGTFPIKIKSSVTFPTPQDDGTYPHVALVDSPELHQIHCEIVDILNRYSPNLVADDFTGKNFSPHITLKYTDNKDERSLLKKLVWTVDEMYLSYHGGKEMFPLPLEKARKESSNASHLQIGDFTVPVSLQSDNKEELTLRVLQGSQVSIVSEMEGNQATLVTPSSKKKMQILEVRESGIDTFQVSYRPLTTYMSKESELRLERVAGILKIRGFTELSMRVSRFLSYDEDFDNPDDEDQEDDDVEALGPGHPGTDPHIVTYVKAPQTQISVEEPSFPQSLPLHERI